MAGPLCLNGLSSDSDALRGCAYSPSISIRWERFVSSLAVSFEYGLQLPQKFFNRSFDFYSQVSLKKPASYTQGELANFELGLGKFFISRLFDEFNAQTIDWYIIVTMKIYMYVSN